MRSAFFAVWYLITITLFAALIAKYEEKEDRSWIEAYVLGFNEINFDEEPVYQWDLEVLELLEEIDK